MMRLKKEQFPNRSWRSPFVAREFFKDKDSILYCPILGPECETVIDEISNVYSVKTTKALNFHYKYRLISFLINGLFFCSSFPFLFFLNTKSANRVKYPYFVTKSNPETILYDPLFAGVVVIAKIDPVWKNKVLKALTLKYRRDNLVRILIPLYIAIGAICYATTMRF